MNNNDSQLISGTQNDDQNDPQTVTVTAPGHTMPSIHPPMPVQFGTPDSNASLGQFMTYGMLSNFNRQTAQPQVGGLGRLTQDSSPFKPLSQLHFRQVDLAMNHIAHGANQVPAAAADTPTSYPQTHGFVTQGGGDTQPSTNSPPSDSSVDGAGTDISTGSSSNPVPTVYNSKRIFFREDNLKTSSFVGDYLITVPLPEGLEVCRNIKKLYKDDFVSRLLIYKSKLDNDAASTSSLGHVQPGKFGSYAECKACYTKIKLSDKPSFDPKEWELHSAECLAREEDSKFFV